MKAETLLSVLSRPMTWRQLWRASNVGTIELEIALRGLLADGRIVQDGALYRSSAQIAEPEIVAPVDGLANLTVTFEGGMIHLKPRGTKA